MYKDQLKEWEKQREEVYQLHSQGYSINKIARMKNLTSSSIWSKLNKYRKQHKNA